MSDIKCVACVFGPYKMGWGKHKGEVLTDLPKSYLIWLAETQGYAEIIRSEFDCLENHKDRTKYYETDLGSHMET